MSVGKKNVNNVVNSRTGDSRRVYHVARQSVQSFPLLIFSDILPHQLRSVFDSVPGAWTSAEAFD